MTTLEDLSGATLYLDSNVFIYALEAPDAPAHPVTRPRCAILASNRRGISP